MVELLFEPLLGWHDWVVERRSAEGSLGAGLSGGRTALISLGSDGPPLVREGLNTPHTLSAARYESGLDNSPQYDGPYHQNEGYGLGPLEFNSTTFHMELYDVSPESAQCIFPGHLIAIMCACGMAGP